MFITVVIAAVHFSEGQEFVQLLEKVTPGWLLFAVCLQILTYLAQGTIWRAISSQAKTPIPLLSAFKLSIAELFVDQALPSGGLSGTLVVAKFLERLGMARSLVIAGVVVSGSAYYIAYVLCLVVALLIMSVGRQSNEVVIILSCVFLIFATLLILALLSLAGSSREGVFIKSMMRIPLLNNVLLLLKQAESQLAHNRQLLARATLLQITIVLLDAATMWCLILSLGISAAPSSIFMSFMVSTLFRTISVIPGGLGTFEAASVVSLKLAGVPLPVALSATLLFRGVSFWLPMIPGFILSRSLMGAKSLVNQPREIKAYWNLPVAELTQQLHSTLNGLASAEASKRLAAAGPNELHEQKTLSRFTVLWNQLRSPLLLILVFAAVVSAITGEWVDALIVVSVLLASVGIGFSREYRAQQAAAKLGARLQTHTRVLRDGIAVTVATREIVSGDLVLLSVGNLVPADSVIMEANDFFINEAVLTGESFPVEKKPGIVPASAGLSERNNSVFLGTHVRSGSARCLVVNTGQATQFGDIAYRLTLRPPETDFDRGIRRFGALLTSAMLVMVLLVFAINIFLDRPAVETLLFSIALAVGLSPELLPVILSINLGRGAQMMARHGVLVKRLTAIENLGSMDILCTDKTGTLTEGVVQLDGAYDWRAEHSAEVLALGSLNAALQAGLVNPLDEAILQARTPAADEAEKLGEIPYDFVRKRLSVVVRDTSGIRIITKGAFEQVLAVCSQTRDGVPLEPAVSKALHERCDAWNKLGIRVLAVAARPIGEQSSYTRADECALEFWGFLTFLDRPKEGVTEALQGLRQLGVAVKLISGDNKRVCQHVATAAGMCIDRVLTGSELDELHDEALWHAAEKTDLFVEVDPNQKERIILALKKMGHVVGFLGDGINDAPAMHAADTSLSVEHAVDVAREAADFVLLDRHLDVIRRGIEEGRKTFANTLKYVLTTTSANLGNMVSMAIVSLALPFLPLLAGQILLNNFLSDIPAFGLANDSVDAELVDRPNRWDMKFIGRYMVEFGLLSSVFDFLTFGVLFWFWSTTPELFRTAWFVESLLTELAIALVVRTRRPFFRSRPSTFLWVSTLVLAVLAFVIPFLPHADLLGFTPLPLSLLALLVGITLLYVMAAEVTKSFFYREVNIFKSLA